MDLFVPVWGMEREKGGLVFRDGRGGGKSSVDQNPGTESFAAHPVLFL